MLVSVVVPVYNVDRYLKNCLDSIIEQTYKNIEIIIIDDGSTDNSNEICQHYALNDKRIMLIRQENRGLGPSRNLGIEYARGEYIAFIDSDDWWEKSTVEKLVNAATINNADLVYMNFYYTYINDDDSIAYERPFIQYNSFGGVSNANEKPEIIFSPDARIWSKMYRRSLFVDNDIKMPAHPYEDFPVMPLLILKAKRICQVHECLYHYRCNRCGSLSRDFAYQRYVIDGIRDLYNNFTAYGYLEKYQKQLEKYLFWLVKYTVDKGVKPTNYSPDELAAYNKEFIDLLYELCPSEMDLFDKQAVCFISESGKHIVGSILFDAQFVYRSPLTFNKCAEFTQDYLNRDVIFIDFLDIGIQRTSFDIDGFCKFVDTLLKHSTKKLKVVLLKLLFSETYGTNITDIATFANIDEIRKINQELEHYYNKFEDFFFDVSRTISFFDLKNYSYLYTPTGCKPFYYNGKFHELAGQKIKQAICESGE